MPVLSRACALALLAASLGGCNSMSGLSNIIGGTGGVMPESDIGPPPSMRDKLPGKMAGTPRVDEDGNPLPSTPTRQLSLPKTVGGNARTADAGSRRINREEIDGGNAAMGAGSSSGGLSPSLSSGGGVGVGGKF